MIRMTGSELRQHGLFISRTTDSDLLLKIDALSAYSMGDLDRCVNYKKQAEPITPISPACFHYMRKEVGLYEAYARTFIFNVRQCFATRLPVLPLPIRSMVLPLMCSCAL